MSYVHEEPLTEANYPPFGDIKEAFGFPNPRHCRPGARAEGLC
jgi:hypothetical protein